MKRLLTRELVTKAHQAGARHLSAPRDEVIVTPDAFSAAHELGVTIDQSTGPQHGTRVSDPSGITVVRGDSVELAPFPAAGAGRDVRLADFITARDGAQLAAGVMSWARDDSFPWKLDYDEIDLVLEGELHITVDGRVLTAKAGDVVSIPRGSSIVFGTPSRVKVFYVTWPANWASAPARPRK
ncbi:MAG: cupin domain-containing protein [Myxococcota bacterium]